MKLIVNRESLVTCLSLVADVVERRSPSFVASCALLTSDGHTLAVFATDLSISIRTSCPIVSGDEGAVGVPAKDLLERLKAMTDATVDLTLSGDKLALKSGRRNYTVRTQPAGEFPPFPRSEDAGDAVEVPAGLLRQAIEKVQHAITDDPNANGFGCRVRLTGGRLSFAGTTNAMMAVVDVACPGELQEMILGPRSVALLRSAGERLGAEDPVTLKRSESKVWIDDGAAEIACPIAMTKFHNVDEGWCFAPKNAPSFTVDRAAMIQSVKATALSADSKLGHIELQAKDGTLRVAAVSSDGEANDELDAEVDREVSFTVIDRVALATLNACPGDRVKIVQAAPGSMAFVQAVDDWIGTVRFIVMPTVAGFRAGGK